MLETTTRPTRLPILLAGLALILGVFVACGGHDGDHGGDHGGHHGEEHAGHDEGDAGYADEGDASAPGDGAPRVFFTNVEDGDEVTSPVRLEFDVENYEIVPAQDPVVVEEGKGHHHLAVNGGCEEPGVVLPKAAPWIHFGDGGNSIDMQLPAGKAQLTLQVGDGEHRTLDEPGLCLSIEVTVVEGEATEADAE